MTTQFIHHKLPNRNVEVLLSWYKKGALGCSKASTGKDGVCWGQKHIAMAKMNLSTQSENAC
jgi:hypothetical protein